MHYGQWPANTVDHIDRNRANNAILNLRSATEFQQRGNIGIKQNNTSGHRGVNFINTAITNPWRAKIRKDNQYIHIGVYSTAEEASAAYEAKARELFGEFYADRKTLGLTV